MDDKSIEKILEQIIADDVGRGDITTAITPIKEVTAQIKSKSGGTLAGIHILSVLFKQHDLDFSTDYSDGDSIQPGDIVFVLKGKSRIILLIERTALNILSFMSGIASITKKYCETAVIVSVAATRKTHPFFGLFEKKAVAIGGGLTHRMGLDDMYLIKENHLALFDSLEKPIQLAKKDLYHKVEVEVSTKIDAIKAAKEGADIIMLDNMDPKDVEKTVQALVAEGVRENITIEASGGITLENIGEYAKTGIDVISTSDLTQARSLDFSLTIK